MGPRVLEHRPDYVIAATTTLLGAVLWTHSVRHFPMFADLQAPY